MKKKQLIKAGLALLTFGILSLIANWPIALILMIHIGWHELGHLRQMTKEGIKHDGFYFLPFVGGAAISTDRIKSRWSMSKIVLAGPFAGMSLTVLCMLLYLFTSWPWFAVATMIGAMINLLNLLPLSVLDGGKLARSVCFSMNKKLGFFCFWTVIILCFVVFVFYIKVHWILLIFIALASIAEYWEEKNNYKKTEFDVLQEDFAKAVDAMKKRQGYDKNVNILIDPDCDTAKALKQKGIVPEPMTLNQGVGTCVAWAFMIIILACTFGLPIDNFESKYGKHAYQGAIVHGDLNWVPDEDPEEVEK